MKIASQKKLIFFTIWKLKVDHLLEQCLKSSLKTALYTVFTCHTSASVLSFFTFNFFFCLPSHFHICNLIVNLLSTIYLSVNMQKWRRRRSSSSSSATSSWTSQFVVWVASVVTVSVFPATIKSSSDFYLIKVCTIKSVSRAESWSLHSSPPATFSFLHFFPIFLSIFLSYLLGWLI